MVKNVRDTRTRVVHLIMQLPVRPDREKPQLAGVSGMTECVEYFRWWGQSAWLHGEMVGDPVEDPPTCLFCLVES